MKRFVLASAAVLILAAGAAFAQTIDDLRTTAEGGDVEAQLALAGAYYRGDRVPRDYAEAVRWLTLAAEQIAAAAKDTAVGRVSGSFTYEDGSTYEGEYEDGKVHGQGTYTWSDGTVYEGSFESGLPHGQGRLTWPSGGVYEGSFESGLKHGDGRITWPSGDVYEGKFKNGFAVEGYLYYEGREQRIFAYENPKGGWYYLTPDDTE